MPDRHTHIINPALQPQEAILKQMYHASDSITIFDIGACEGESSIRYSKMFPNSRIFTFEPLQKNIGIIKNNIQKYNASNIILCPICVSDRIGTVEFHVSSGTPEEFKDKELDWDFGNKSSSILPAAELQDKFHPWLKFTEKVEVASTTVRQFMQDNRLDKVEFIHMDVQGAELMVLGGADLDTIKAVWLEVEAVELYKNQPLKKDVERFFRKQGFVKLIDTVSDLSGDQFWIQRKVLNASLPLILILLSDRLSKIFIDLPKRMKASATYRFKKFLGIDK